MRKSCVGCEFIHDCDKKTEAERRECKDYCESLDMTNEEWLDSMTTKEKAEWMFKLTYKCYWCGREYTARSKNLFNEKDCPFTKCMRDKKDFEKWLKEKHDEMPKV